MKVLKLTILLEQGISAAELMNTFGRCDTFTMPGTRNRYLQFTFPSVKFLTAMHLRPIHDLIKTYEAGLESPLRLKFFHLQDTDGTISPISIVCTRGLWSSVHASSWEEIQSSPSLFGLF